MSSAKRRKAKRTTLRNKADRLFSLYIRGRDRVCVKCGRQVNLQCAHVFSRRYMNVRFDPRNAVTLCAGCHKYFTHNPIEWEDFMVERMGTVAYSELRADARRTDTRVDYEAIIEWLESEAA